MIVILLLHLSSILFNTIVHHTCLTKNNPKENETECTEQHITQAKPSSQGTHRYYGSFLPQRDLSFGKTGAYAIDISLNIPVSFSKYHAEMLVFDPGKFFHKINHGDLYHALRY